MRSCELFLDCVLKLLPLVLENIHRVLNAIISARILFYRGSVSWIQVASYNLMDESRMTLIQNRDTAVSQVQFNT